MKMTRLAAVTVLALLFVPMLNVFTVQAAAAPVGESFMPAPSGLSPKAAGTLPPSSVAVDFIAADSKDGQVPLLESVFSYWGFEYYPPDGKWTAEDIYELTLFQRWAGVKPTGCVDFATRQALRQTWLVYGSEMIPRQKLPLEGRYIGINPGHQKKANYQTEPMSPELGSPVKIKVSSGTQGRSTRVPEYIVTLSVGLKLRGKLEAMGARVLMTRTTHNVNISNGERSRMMNTAGVEVYLSLHCDGSNSRRISGLHTLIPGERGYQTGDILLKSQKFARIMQAEAIKATKAVDRGFSIRRDLTGFNWTKVPTCLVEMGYMTNAAEDKRLVTGAYQDKIVSGMAAAFVRYFKEVE